MKIFKTADRVSFKGSKVVKKRVKDNSDQGYHFVMVSEPVIKKGKIGATENLSIPVKIKDGTIRQIPYPMLTAGYGDKVTFQEKLPDKTAWEGTKLVIVEKGKTIKVTGKVILDSLIIPVITSDGHINHLQVKDLEGVRR